MSRTQVVGTLVVRVGRVAIEENERHAQTEAFEALYSVKERGIRRSKREKIDKKRVSFEGMPEIESLL